MFMKNEIIEKFTVLITSAFGLVAALAWNAAIQEIIKNYGLEKYGLWLYAAIVTVMAIAITLVLGWISEKAKKVSIQYKKRRK
jgi:uncharacterized membrane protein YidH (DUF202 family)